MANTKWIQLTDYCLVEYDFYDLSPNTTKIIEDDFIVVRNSDTDVNQIYNEDSDDGSIRNVQDNSVIYIGNNKYVKNDTETVPNYSDYNDDITDTQISSQDVPYDLVRFHFISGFNFDEFEALIFTIANEQNNGIQCFFANLLVNSNNINSMISINPKPIFLTDALYDRYIQIKIPSIQKINEDYYSATVKSGTLGALFTPTSTSYSGLISERPIRIGIHECQEGTSIVNEDNEDIEYEVWVSNEFKDASIPQISRFDNMGLVIEEADDGDYIRYYATESGRFIDDFVGELQQQNPNDDWVLIHQLSIYEQVGSAFIKTGNFMNIQEDDFDEPNEFRPILKNSDTAISFSIDYLYRFLNRNTGEQIIRTGSMSSFNVKKYGKNIEPIKLSGAPQSQKVYNRIFNKNNDVTRLFIEPTIAEELSSTDSSTSVVERNVYVPVYFNVNRVSASSRTLTVSNSGKEEDIIFKQGGMLILLAPLDNYYKFKFYEIVDGVPTELNLDIGATYSMVLYGMMNDSYTYDTVQDNTVQNLSKGEIAFKVPKKDAIEVLGANYNNTFYIVVNGADGSQSIMYEGKWTNSENSDLIQQNIDAAREEALENTETVETSTTENIGTTQVDIPGGVPEQPSDKDEVSSALKKKPKSES